MLCLNFSRRRNSWLKWELCFAVWKLENYSVTFKKEHCEAVMEESSGMNALVQWLPPPNLSPAVMEWFLSLQRQQCKPVDLSGSQQGLSCRSYRIPVYRWSCRTARHYKQPGAIIHFQCEPIVIKDIKALLQRVTKAKPLSLPFSFPNRKWHTLCGCLQNHSALNQHIVTLKQPDTRMFFAV